MVISKILSVLQASGRIDYWGAGGQAAQQQSGGGGGGSAERDATRPAVTVVAMHIDYSNRPESADEAAFVRDWACGQLGFEWRLRRISEVTRGVTDRSDYERISREIRYSFYRDCVTEWWSVPAGDKRFSRDRVVIPGAGVMFGHHIGDVQENVISNVMRYSVAASAYSSDT
jgi:tRNA(Ile)-lysidine synthase TilS/MesJ